MLDTFLLCQLSQLDLKYLIPFRRGIWVFAELLGVVLFPELISHVCNDEGKLRELIH